MKRSDFCRIVKQARDIDILNDQWFNTMGWFWLNLTELQASVMYRLILAQGGEEKTEPETLRKYVELKNGMRLYGEV